MLKTQLLGLFLYPPTLLLYFTGEKPEVQRLDDLLKFIELIIRIRARHWTRPLTSVSWLPQLCMASHSKGFISGSGKQNEISLRNICLLIRFCLG